MQQRPNLSAGYFWERPQQKTAAEKICAHFLNDFNPNIIKSKISTFNKNKTTLVKNEYGPALIDGARVIKETIRE